MNDETLLSRAVEAVACADALLVGAGAGMGVDSGLPDFRGSQGFWRAYPPYEKLGLSFTALANPRWFLADPELAWGFYGHRLRLYRNSRPHDGFQILRSWAARVRHGAWVFTSNVDGHFQRAGFDAARILEVHGTIHWLQCTQQCGLGLFRADGVQVEVDETTMRARPPLPACPSCGALARPNILMFNDGGWDPTRSDDQETRFRDWLHFIREDRLVVIECGAGTAIPTVRHTCEAAAISGATLVRINPHEPSAPPGHIGMKIGAREGLRSIDEQLSSL